ncbi:hypothetical protein EZS27_023883 [termite gut metagenome]|jgi:hypothetical protein|uniref:Helix-turn-helix domain-containing protein n=1 Tax=termite gut metagenome TaxID=433724 RepID=A0A5J4R0L3_9ZZZZ
MEIITMESKAYQELISKINFIAKFVVLHQADDTNSSDEWVDSYDVCTFLKINERTLQRLRSKRMVNYSRIQGKNYYKLSEIRRLMNENLICSSEECLLDLIKNHKLYAQQRRDIKANQ